MNGLSQDSLSSDAQTDKKSVVEEFMVIEYDNLANKHYTKMIILLTIQWSAASFGTYLLIYLNKYLSGNIFINYYFDGVSGLIAYSIGNPLYQYAKIRNAFLISNYVTIFGGLGLILFESGAISPYFINNLGCPPSGFPPESEKDK